MHGQKDDRRVKYTKKALKDSLISLLQQKTIDKITITQICAAADINRSTFYAHYNDQYDLLEHIETEVLQEINTYLSNYNFSKYEPESFQILSRIFEYALDNAELCQVLLGANGDLTLQRGLMTIVQSHSMKEWSSRMELDPAINEYLLIFGVNGCIGMVQKWVQSGMKNSAREMAELVSKMTYKGLSAFVPQAD